MTSYLTSPNNKCLFEGCDYIFEKTYGEGCCGGEDGMTVHLHCPECDVTDTIHYHCTFPGCVLTFAHYHCEHCDARQLSNEYQSPNYHKYCEGCKKCIDGPHGFCERCDKCHSGVHAYCKRCKKCIDGLHEHCPQRYPDGQTCNRTTSHRHCPRPECNIKWRHSHCDGCGWTNKPGPYQEHVCGILGNVKSWLRRLQE
jgi:hypothetical protein